MPHNDSYDFEKQASPDDKNAFLKRYGIHRILLPAGTELFRRTDGGLVNAKGKISPWWSFVYSRTVELTDGTSLLAPGWWTSQVRASSIGATEREFTQARAAVSEHWNSLSGAVHVKLIPSSYAWFGKCAGQPRFAPRSGESWKPGDPRNVIWIGGGYQVFLPNLEVEDLFQV